MGMVSPSSISSGIKGRVPPVRQDGPTQLRGIGELNIVNVYVVRVANNDDSIAVVPSEVRTRSDMLMFE